MPVRKLEDLDVHQFAKTIHKTAYPIIRDIPDRDYRSQMNRSNLSILSNIAEGYGRRSNAEFAKFLSYSSGSVYELRTQILACVDVGLLKESDILPLSDLCESEAKMIYNLMRTLRAKE